MVVIRTDWNSKPADFVFDTGCTSSILDSTAFPSLTKATDPVAYDTPAGQMTQVLYQPPNLNIGPLRLADGGLVVRSDLSMFRTLLGRPVAGLLGNDLCRNLVVQIDFDDGEILFLKPDDRPHPEWGTPIQIESAKTPHGLDNQYARVRVIIDGFEDLFIVDSGLILGGNLPTDGFDQILDATTRPVARRLSYSLKGVTTQRFTRTPQFALGGLYYHDLIFGEDYGWEGRLGLSFLSRHLVTLDFPHAKLYLKPGKAFNRRDDWDDVTGMSLSRSTKSIILTISPNSPAYSAGLRDGDVLTQINGNDANSYTSSDLLRLLIAKEGTEINVHYLRDGLDHSVTFKLRHWF
jgi:hypothetical protein